MSTLVLAVVVLVISFLSFLALLDSLLSSAMSFMGFGVRGQLLVALWGRFVVVPGQRVLLQEARVAAGVG